MAVDVFLKLGDIKGESKDSKHAGEIEVLSWSWGVSQTGSMGHGGGGGAGKANFSDLSVMHQFDKASPNLMKACATGEHIKEATLIARKAGKEQQEYMKITLSDVLVSSYQDGGGSGGVVPTDQFSLNYGKIEFEYLPQKPDGTLGAAVKGGYDVAANKKV